MIKIVLKPGKDQAVRRLHPWVFSGAIARLSATPTDGEVVAVYDAKQEWLGVGHFHNGSIAVRILSFQPTDVTQPGFWIDRLQNALKVRALFLPINTATVTYRLIHGEGDGLPGLVIDWYAGTAVVQCHSIGMHLQLPLITTALQTVFGAQLQAVYDKSYESLPAAYAATQQNGYCWQRTGYDNTAGRIVDENGVQFLVDWQTGQKTGFFLDQRDNRALLARFAPGKSVLNTFCYTGGFSCYALKAGAALVHSVDVSARAMELCAQNVDLNRPFSGQHEGFAEDVLKYLKQTAHQYDVMVVDPPAYAKSLEKRHNAVQGYKRLNVEAIRKVAPGGVLFTFSCSQVVDRTLFYHTIASAAMEVGRPARVLHHLTQGADHPVSLYHPEGAYLKGLVVKLD